MSSLRRLLEEVRLLGPRGAAYRLAFEFQRRSGLGALRKPVVSFDTDRYLRDCQGVPEEADEFLRWWREKRPRFGLTSAESAHSSLAEMVPDPGAVSARGERLRQGWFSCFHAYDAHFGSEPDWYLNPETGSRWPRIHSSRLLLEPHMRRHGDIKLTWEIGRFSWVFDLVRAYSLDRDSQHMETLFSYLQSFSGENSMFLGPHWASEQEVGIRSLALIMAMEVLADDPCLNAERLRTLHTMLYFHGRFLSLESGYAERAIRNNHLIHAAVGSYAIGHALPWCRDGQRWCREGRETLMEALDEQWYADGGYVQPSNNYQRSSWHGILSALKIADQRGDAPLAESIRRRIPASRRFFLAQLDRDSGHLPNWGPNDGSLVGNWTEADYADFRPLVQSMSVAAGLPAPFPAGCWDEESMWLFGPESLRGRREPRTTQGITQFPAAGIHVLRPREREFAMFRCGSVRSRYGQQADQLHVDVWCDGLNVAVDPGSYNYNKDRRSHDWFRGTAAHNTVTLEGRDQMVPHRKFKFLSWTRSFSEPCAAGAADLGMLGAHDGYLRLPGRWIHARLAAHAFGKWVIVDRLWPTQTAQQDVTARLHWLLADVPYSWTEEGILTLELPTRSWGVVVASDQPPAPMKLNRASEVPFEGWNSRHYNVREPALSLSTERRASTTMWFATVMGPGERIGSVPPRFDLERRRLHLRDKEHLLLDDLMDLRPDFAIEDGAGRE